jgi:hypothetical protein
MKTRPAPNPLAATLRRFPAAAPSGLSGRQQAGRAAASRPRPGEQGYLLISVVFLTFMVLIALSVAAPKVAADLQRDREIELMHRGKQYRRAIQLYYRKFHAYPPTMEALEKSNEIRFLRRRYKDPMTGKDEWHLIHFGEAKTQTLGFFGQPIAGAGSAGGSLLAGTGPGATPGLGTPIGGSATDPNAANSSTPSPTDPNSTTSTTDPNAGNSSTSTGPGGLSGPGGISGASSLAGNSTGSSFGSSSFGNSNQQTFGGGGIIGVESTSPKTGILEYKKKKKYNEWEFVYDPISESLNMGGNTGAIGQPIGGQNNSGFGSTQSGQPGSGPGGTTGGTPPVYSPNGNLPPVNTPQ